MTIAAAAVLGPALEPSVKMGLWLGYCCIISRNRLRYNWGAMVFFFVISSVSNMTVVGLSSHGG